MSMRWVRVEDVATRRIEPIAVAASASYRMLGLLNRGRGFFRRGVISGTETSYASLYEVRPGDLVYSKLFGWEGSIALADESLRGGHVSSEFPIFEPDQGVVLPAYLAHVICTEQFVAQMADSTTGMGQRRQRVNPERFLEVKFPLPDLDEQRRIAARLDAIAAAATEIEVRTAPRGDFRSLAPRLVEAVFAEAGLRRVHARELYSIVSDVVHPGMDASPAARFVGLEHVEPHTGRKLSQMPLDSFRGRKLRFLAGDVLYGYLRPYLNKVWRADGPGLCSVEQYVLRPRAGVNADLLGYALRSQDTLDCVNEATHRLQLPRIRTALLGDIEIPDVRKAGTSLLDRLESVTERIARVDMARVRQESTLRSLLPAARNEEFARLTSA